MSLPTGRRHAGRFALFGLFLLCAAAPLALIRPFRSAPIGPDAAATVIDFERLLAGQRLEGYLSQTSKPLLTVIYGLAWSTFHDWRVISILAVLAFALMVVLSATLAYRLGGPASAAFATVGLVFAPELLSDLTFAYGLPWALLGWTAAGVLVTADRPRYPLAGIALALAALARPEGLAVTAAALAALAIGAIFARLLRQAAPDLRAWWLALGLLAIPAFMVHDWALTGDPFFWANTALTNSAGQQVRDLLGMLAYMIRFLWNRAPLVLLMAVGVVVFIVRREWTKALVVATVPVAVAAFYVAAGARGTLIASRYFAPTDLGMIFGAGVGLGTLDIPALRTAWPSSDRRIARTAPIVALLAGGIAAAALTPIWITKPADQHAVARQRVLHRNAARAFGVLAHELGPPPAWRGQPVPTNPVPLVMIPPRLRAQGVVDLDLPLWAAQKSFLGQIDPIHGLPAPGTILYHDSRDDKPDPRWTAIEISQPTVIGRLRFVPIFVDAHAGIWILRVEDAAAG
jgi:hypothetical protein